MKTLKQTSSHLVYLCMRGLWYALSLLPLRLLYVLSDGLYFLMAHVVKYRHRVIWKNLRASFPDKTEVELRAIEKGFYRYFCDYFVETIKLMTMSKEELMRRMTFSGVETVNAVLEEGQSVGFYLGHLGNWEWITSLPHWLTKKAVSCQIYHPLENAEIDRLFKDVRERQGAHCIAMSESLRKIVQFGRAGQPVIVGYIADQSPLWWNIHHWVTFLNQDTPVFTGSERIVKHTHQAFVYGDVRRIKRGYYHCELQLICRDTKEKADFELTDIYFQRLEATIRREPAIYLWSHNRWKRTREDFNRLYYVDENGKVLERKNMENK